MPSKICPKCSYKMKNVGSFEDSKSDKHNNIFIHQARKGIRFQCPHCYNMEENVIKDRQTFIPTQPPDLTSVKDYNRVILAIGKTRRHGTKLRGSLSLSPDEFKSRLKDMANKGLCCFELALEKRPVEPIWVWLPEKHVIDILYSTHPIDYDSTVEQCSLLREEILKNTPNTNAGEKLHSIVKSINMREFEILASEKGKPLSKSQINKLVRILRMLKLIRLLVDHLVKNSPTTHADIRKTLHFSINEYQNVRNALEDTLELPLAYFGVFAKTTKKRTKLLPYEMNDLLDETELNLREFTYNALSQRNNGKISIKNVLPSNVTGYARNNIKGKLMKKGSARNIALSKAGSILQEDVSSKSFITVLEQILLSHYRQIFEDSINWAYFSPIFASLDDMKKHLNIIVDARNVIKHVIPDPIDIIPTLDSFLWLHLKITPFLE